MDAPPGSRGSIADPVAEVLASTSGVPIECGVFGSGTAVGCGLRAGVGRRSAGVMTSAV